MDDLSERLAEILNDPESLDRVRTMAESILGESATPAKENPPDISSALENGGLDATQITKIMSVMSRLKLNQSDNRSGLLLALKPHLSVPRREKVDTAIKLLKLIDLLPLLKDSGIFEF